MKNYSVKNKNYCVNNEKYCVNKLIYCVNNFGFDIQPFGCAQLASPQGSLNFVNPYPDLCNLQGNAQETELFYYHPDHLGSTGMVTDNSSIISQGFLYAPFGEIISEYTPGWETDRIPKYAFNAKEFDEENGMYYYSARYYAPPTFISRNPMFEKYPSISPYTYCSNNPINRIDPSGEDDYEVDLVNKKITVVDGTQGQPDRFVVKNEKGEKIYSNPYDNGTIKKLDSKIEAYAVTGDNNGKELFEFLAKHTGNEFVHIQSGEGGEENGNNYLFTTFNPGESGFDLSVVKGRVREINHNHTDGTTSYSDKDQDALLLCQWYNYRIEGRFPYKGSDANMPESNIFNVGKGYTPYFSTNMLNTFRKMMESKTKP
ncbi:MAG: JAB-like toxin 1 domain-containing protein [Bacteroidales bacterium]|nr:JAB-like toxin 1 domain-containing protein [Bacteroidales bacterium]MDD4208999.1 JAB-like toxin 1 domain-containing protein [Bacteroidales bacterium]